MSWISDNGRQRYLVIENTGSGTANVLNVQLQNEPNEPAEDFRYAADRDTFPFELGSGASFQFQLDKAGQAHPTNVLVKWRDGRLLTQSRRVPVSSRR